MQPSIHYHQQQPRIAYMLDAARSNGCSILLISAMVNGQCSAAEPAPMILGVAATVLHGVSVMRRCDALPGVPLDSDILQPELRH